jgi:hypothetical protein
VLSLMLWLELLFKFRGDVFDPKNGFIIPFNERTYIIQKNLHVRLTKVPSNGHKVWWLLVHVC